MVKWQLVFLSGIKQGEEGIEHIFHLMRRIIQLLWMTGTLECGPNVGRWVSPAEGSQESNFFKYKEVHGTYIQWNISHKKECNWVRSNEVNEPIIQWSKSEWEKQILYTNAYIWNLGRWYWWTYFQGSNGDADTENRLVDAVREGEGRMNRAALKHGCYHMWNR